MPGVLHAKSASAALLQEPGLVQLVPIAHHESSKLAVKGSWVATEPGEYVLYWDNTFSVSTPKKLTYFVSVVPYVPPADPQPGAPAVVIEGWLSKKRSKKMQGWARRWFRLLSDGTLEYAEKRGGEIRGAARVPAAVVTEDAKRLRIDVDSGSALFHMRCANDADFAAWSSALRSFELPEDAEPDGEPEHEDGERPLPAPPTLEALTITPADARPSPLGPRGSFTGEESPYDILKREIARVAEAAHLASLLPPDPDGAASDLAPLLRSIQSRLQRAAEGLLLGNPSPGAMFHPSLGRRLVAGRAASILSAATGVSDEGEFFDAYEGESEPGEGEEEEGEEGMEGEGVPSSAGSAVGIEPPAFESAAELPPPTPAPAEPGAPFFPPARPRRAVLPAPGSCESPVSILSILRGSMGKDLSTISMPIQLNEPLSALQRLAEEFEYSDLLVRACASGDAAERTVLVAAFAVSGYAGTVHRAGRKPFNPLLGETYELARPEAGWRFLAEKVSHHPPVLAYEGEGWCAGGRGWKVWGDSQVKSKFWGKTMEFLPVGSPVRVLLRLGNGREERYTYNRVTTCMRNLIGGGSRYLEHVGELLVRNENTGHACVLQFRESGYFSAAKNEVAGSVRDGDGRDVGKVTGRWDSVISRSVGPGGQGGREVLEVVWRGEPVPPGSPQRMYGFTAFAAQLNEAEDGTAPTDSRLRPDQRLFEEGRIDNAEAEKTRLEEKQRAARREGREARARWFVGVETGWEYKGGYWECRAEGRWPEDLPDIF
ncbi:Oxysterol-binding protein-domain-containing protein [Hyaloraphidium curvatum]|nr:Oxysterol-binding protein-domain-containing protein [Hyaloraphidium curvatum]